MENKATDGVAMLADDLLHLKRKKMDAEEKSARWLMKANDIDEKISAVLVAIAKAQEAR